MTFGREAAWGKHDLNLFRCGTQTEARFCPGVAYGSNDNDMPGGSVVADQVLVFAVRGSAASSPPPQSDTKLRDSTPFKFVAAAAGAPSRSDRFSAIWCEYYPYATRFGLRSPANCFEARFQSCSPSSRLAAFCRSRLPSKMVTGSSKVATDSFGQPATSSVDEAQNNVDQEKANDEMFRAASSRGTALDSCGTLPGRGKDHPPGSAVPAAGLNHAAGDKDYEACSHRGMPRDARFCMHCGQSLKLSRSRSRSPDMQATLHEKNGRLDLEIVGFRLPPGVDCTDAHGDESLWDHFRANFLKSHAARAEIKEELEESGNRRHPHSSPSIRCQPPAELWQLLQRWSTADRNHSAAEARHARSSAASEVRAECRPGTPKRSPLLLDF